MSLTRPMCTRFRYSIVVGFGYVILIDQRAFIIRRGDYHVLRRLLARVTISDEVGTPPTSRHTSPTLC